MAQRVQILLVCDVHGNDVAGAETVAFAVDGASYEIDVCEQHAGELRDAVAPYVGAARRVGAGRSGGRRSGGRRSGGSGNQQRVGDIRAWAKSRGLKVNERGRIARSIVEQYDAEH